MLVLQGAKDAPSRPHKRPRLGPSPHDNEDKSNKPTKAAKTEDGDAKVKSKKSKKDAQLDEFMHVMKPKKSGPSWVNDLGAPDVPNGKSKDPPTEAKTKKLKPSKHVDDTTTEDQEMAVDEDAPNEGMSDLDWMKRRMSKTLDAESKVFEQSDEEQDAEDSDNEEVNTFCFVFAVD